MTYEETKREYWELVNVFTGYMWDIAAKRNIRRRYDTDGYECFNGKKVDLATWDKVASEDEKTQALMFYNEVRKAWRVFLNVLHNTRKELEK